MLKIKQLIIILFIGLLPLQTFAEKSEHFFFKGEFSSMNIIPVFAGMGIAALINRSSNDFVWDNMWMMGGFIDAEIAGESITSDVDFWGFKPHQLFSLLGTGVKMGYKTDNVGFFNFKGYGSLHYQTSNRMMTDWENRYNFEADKVLNSMHWMQVGIGGIAELGAIHHNVRVALDFGVRYNIPIAYSGPYGEGASALKAGIVPVIRVTVAGRKLMKTTGMNIGLEWQMPSYNVFKESEIVQPPYSLKTSYWGINMTICPWKN